MLGDLTRFRSRLIQWYARSRRDLPWRVSLNAPPERWPDPYHVLLSEVMLQQTQVTTVIPYFNRFITRFATLADLAQAHSQEILKLWQGLGYYSRARNLHACAKAICDQYGGNVPRTVAELLELPGVGRYTAGAIASLAFDTRAPIVDGNVSRVLCRLDRIEDDPRQRNIQQRLWSRAEEILPRRRVGDFNSALMELGATVCTPRNPKCLICPVRCHCQAACDGVADRIPPPRQAKPTPLMRRCVLCVRSGPHWLIEQRPPGGRWGGLWQFKTFDLAGHAPTRRNLETHLARKVRKLTPMGTIEHGLSHRRYQFDVFRCDLQGRRNSAAHWVTMDDLKDYPMSRPQSRIVEMLRRG